MDRWTGILRVPLSPDLHGALFKVAASLLLSPSSTTLAVPSVNAIFFTGDRVEGTGNPVIERFSDAQYIAETLVEKLGLYINAWVVEASTYNGPFAVYKEFVRSVNSWGEPKSYDATNFPASASTVLLLSKCLEQANCIISNKLEGSLLQDMQSTAPRSSIGTPKTIILGFSKGGTVINQLLAEFANLNLQPTTCSSETEKLPFAHFPGISAGNEVCPTSINRFLSSISDFHFVDVGLNSAGAYLTDQTVIKKIADKLEHGTNGLRVVLHGTPRQWCDRSRAWIQNEKNSLLKLLQDAACASKGRLQVTERFYFADKPPNLQMHFEIIEAMDLG